MYDNNTEAAVAAALAAVNGKTEVPQVPIQTTCGLVNGDCSHSFSLCLYKV